MKFESPNRQAHYTTVYEFKITLKGDFYVRDPDRFSYTDIILHLHVIDANDVVLVEDYSEQVDDIKRYEFTSSMSYQHTIAKEYTPPLHVYGLASFTENIDGEASILFITDWKHITDIDIESPQVQYSSYPSPVRRGAITPVPIFAALLVIPLGKRLQLLKIR